jgi:V-type H+-transporting ATPase subunit G
VKDAKSEAQKEIEDYRSQKESEFKTFETEVSRTAEHMFCCTGFNPSVENDCREKLDLGIIADSEQHTSGNKKAEEDAQKATDKQLEEIKQIGEKTGPKVRRQSLTMIRRICS